MDFGTVSSLQAYGCYFGAEGQSLSAVNGTRTHGTNVMHRLRVPVSGLIDER